MPCVLENHTCRVLTFQPMGSSWASILQCHLPAGSTLLPVTKATYGSAGVRTFLYIVEKEKVCPWHVSSAMTFYDLSHGLMVNEDHPEEKLWRKEASGASVRRQVCWKGAREASRPFSSRRGSLSTRGQVFPRCAAPGPEVREDSWLSAWRTGSAQTLLNE